MAFGFISDVVESIGDVVLGEKGSGQRTGKVTQIGAALAGASPAVASFAGKVGTAYASGGGGQAATSTPTVQQRPVYAPESAMSGGDIGTMVYRPQFTPRLPTPTRVPTQTRTTGADLMDLIPDIEISKFFGTGNCGQKLQKLVSVDKDGCPYVTRKQQAQLRKMLMVLPIEEVAYAAGVTTEQIGRMVSKIFPPRRKGISATDIRTANRVNNKLIQGVRKLGYNVSPMTKAELNKMGC